MKTEILYSAEQIKIPEDLGTIIKIFTKDVIRANPSPQDLYKWSANYFAIKSGNKPPFRLKNHPEYDTEENATDKGADKHSGTNMPILVVAGPSGVGKSTVIEKLIQDFPNKFGFSISHTTRPPRGTEMDGVAYHFVTRELMEKSISNGEFIENAEVHGNLYGTSYAAVNAITEQGKCCILDVDVQGVRQIRNTKLNLVAVFIAPPSVEILEKRLRERKTETEENIRKRVANAKGEMQFMNDKSLFDHVVVNDDFDFCYAQFKEIIQANVLSMVK